MFCISFTVHGMNNLQVTAACFDAAVHSSGSILKKGSQVWKAIPGMNLALKYLNNLNKMFNIKY